MARGQEDMSHSRRQHAWRQNPGVPSLILVRSYTFMEIDHEIISTAILLPSPDSRRVVVSYKRKYVHEVLVNCLVKIAQEKSVIRWTDHPN